MPTTLPNVLLPPNLWVNLYTATGIATNETLFVQNVGCHDVYIATGIAEPTDDTAHHVILRSQFDRAGPDGAWAFCYAGGAVNVSSCGASSGGGGGTDSGLVAQVNTAAVVGATVVSDSLAVATTQSAQWVITAVDAAGNSSLQEVFGYVSAGDACYGVPVKLGRDVPFKAVVDVVGGNLELQITNQHTSDVTFKVVRVQTKV